MLFLARASFIALCAVNCFCEEGGEKVTPTQDDWLERHNRLATMLQIIQSRGVNVPSEDPQAMLGLRDAVRGVTEQVDQALAEHAASRPAPLATTTRAAQETGPALFLYWNWKAPGAPSLFPALSRLRSARPSLTIHHIHLQPPSEWQRFFLNFKLDSQAAERDAELLGQTAAAAKWGSYSYQFEPLRAAAAFDGTPGVPPFASVASAIAHRAVRIPTWRYRTTRGTVHALTGTGPLLDLNDWIDRCEAWDAVRAAEAAQRQLPLTAVISTWRPQ